MKSFDLKSLVRPNIWSLSPYSSARDEFSGSEGIFLDANENPYGLLNRYPDPHQRVLKTNLSKEKNVPLQNIFIGNGSDEVIDLIYRIFAEPGKDSVIICPPTYGMYEVSANINGVNSIKVPLTNDFQLDIDALLNRIKNDQSVKIIFACSPNNPTGNVLNDLDTLLAKFNGIVVIDEAYIDFCPDKSYLNKIFEYPNLIVMQTFSKAWALAGARVGIAYAQKDIISLFDKTKPPYNVSKLNQEAAINALAHSNEFEERRISILEQRSWLIENLITLPSVRKIYPSDANFLLIEVSNADLIYNQLITNNVIVRNRNSQIKNCLRITIGTPEENQELIKAFNKIQL
ncbi:MAG: histidinol-phosphate transaminase [Dysgonamonadaceae bacterium]|jgi:histidinol-phosphate aminotransferase|nr:histidinol-phosphate transaminase [Dysgonamonadaceae bacterium]